jgi:hypothetical protein
MNHKFDELVKSMAQSVSRRGAFKKFGLGLAGIALAAVGQTRETSVIAFSIAAPPHRHADVPIS